MNPELELKTFDKYDCWDLVFQKLCTDSQEKYEFSCSDARQQAFRSFNRYKDIIPFNHSRVKIPIIDYINANWVVLSKISQSYILTQGPLVHTVSHFWMMVWHTKCTVVVMLNKLVENNMVKCSPYHPDDMSQSDLDEKGHLNMADVSLRLSLTSSNPHSNYTIRTFALVHTKTDETREISHLQYHSWPDYGVPETPDSLLSFIHLFRSTLPPSSTPIIHCSAGVGRSGSFCLVDACISIAKKDVSELDVCRVLLSMRKFRANLVQVPEQLRFSYLCIIKELKDRAILSPTEQRVAEEEEEEGVMRRYRRFEKAQLDRSQYDDDDDDDDESTNSNNNNNNKNNNSNKCNSYNSNINKNNNINDRNNININNSNNKNNSNTNNSNSNSKMRRKSSREEIILSRKDEERGSFRKGVKSGRGRYSLGRVVPHQASLGDSDNLWTSNNENISGEPVITAGGGEDGEEDGEEEEEDEDGNIADDENDDFRVAYEEEEEDEDDDFDDDAFKIPEENIRRRPLEQRSKQTWRDLHVMKNNQMMYDVTPSRLTQRLFAILVLVFLIFYLFYF